MKADAGEAGEALGADGPETDGADRSPPAPGTGPGEVQGPDVRELQALRAMAAALALVTAAFAAIPSVLFGAEGPLVVASVVLAASGAAVGVAAALAPALRRAGLLLAPGLLAASAAVGQGGLSVGGIPREELALAFAFAVAWLLTVEHLQALVRFSRLGDHVRRQGLRGFDLRGVVNHFMAYSLLLTGMIALVALFVAVGVPWVLSQGSDEVFGNSVELGSVLGIAVSAAIVFTLSALILVFVRAAMPTDVEVERVAYSRERMDDMLRGASLLDTTEGEERP